MKNIKHIVLIALAALALGLASIEAAAPSIAGGGVTGSDFQAGSKPGVAAGSGATAGSKPGIAGGQGEMHTGTSAPRFSIDGAKPGIASGTN